MFGRSLPYYKGILSEKNSSQFREYMEKYTNEFMSFDLRIPRSSGGKPINLTINIEAVSYGA